MMKMYKLKLYCEIAISKPIITRAFKVSLFVGTTLNLINQGDILVHLELQELHFLKILLTYFIPYIVTTYTATALKIEFQIGTKAVVEADLVCKKHHTEIHVQKDELIPECPKCGIHTHWKLK